MGSASPQMRKKAGSRERNSKKHHRHFGGAIIVDNGAKLKQKVTTKEKQVRDDAENEQIEMQRKEWEVGSAIH